MRGWRHRARRLLGSPPSVAVAVLLLLATVLALPPASATFSAATANSGNTLTADQLLPPSTLRAPYSCSTSAISYIGSTFLTSQSPLTLGAPTGTRLGDLLLAQVAYYGTPTVPTPSGWNVLFNQSYGGVITSSVYWKFAVTGEPAASFPRPSSSDGDMVGGIVAYRGVDQQTPFDDQGANAGQSETATTPALTTTRTNSVLVHFLTKAGTVPLQRPSGTSLWKASSDSESITAFYESFVGTGTTPVRSSTTPTASDGTVSASEWIAESVALKRALSAPTLNLSWTASPSSWATGYRLDRSVNGTVRASWTLDRAVTSLSDGPRTSGTTYTYRLWAYRGSWTSGSVTVTVTPSC
jgi:hypothetical protein